MQRKNSMSTGYRVLTKITAKKMVSLMLHLVKYEQVNGLDSAVHL